MLACFIQVDEACEQCLPWSLTSFVLSKVSKMYDDIKKKTDGKKLSQTLVLGSLCIMSPMVRLHLQRNHCTWRQGICCWMKVTLWVPLLQGVFLFYFFVGRNQENSSKIVFLRSQGQDVSYILSCCGDWDSFLSLGTSPYPRQVHTWNDWWLPDFSVSIWRGLLLFFHPQKILRILS